MNDEREDGTNGSDDDRTGSLLQLHPPWREAVKRIAEAEYPPGYMLSFEELYRLLDVLMPKPSTPLSEAQRAELQFLSAFKRLEAALLREHQIALRNVLGVGYEIVPPREQSEWAMREALREARRAVSKGFGRATYVRLNELTDGERAQTADRVATLANLTHVLATRGIKAAADRKALTGDPA